MSQSLSNILVHVVFSTKDRYPFLHDRALRERLHSRLGGTSKTLNCSPIISGGIDDHVRLLARQSRTITLADLVKELKRVTSIWVKEQSPQLDTFAWQSGYGALSVSQSQRNKVAEYIEQQEEHHRTQDFQTEYRAFLIRHGVEYDERYVWD